MNPNSRTGSRTARARTSVGILAAAAAALTACGSDGSGPPHTHSTPVIVDRAWVAGDAAAALTETGSVQTAEPSRRAYPQLTRHAAVRLAEAWIQRFGVNYSELVSRDRAAAVDVRALDPCLDGHVYAESPYQDVAADVSTAVRREYGPYWIIALCTSEREKVATLAVSAFASESVFVPEPRGQRPVQLGNEYFVGGVPRAWGDFPIGPEAAIKLAYMATHERVVSQPMLVQRALPNAPQAALWRLRIERPARVRMVDSGDSGLRTVSEVFVGMSRGQARIYIAVDIQPSAVEVVSPVRLAPKGVSTAAIAPEVADVVVGRRDGFPLTFAEVVVP